MNGSGCAFFVEICEQCEVPEGWSLERFHVAEYSKQSNAAGYDVVTTDIEPEQLVDPMAMASKYPGLEDLVIRYIQARFTDAEGGELLNCQMAVLRMPQYKTDVRVYGVWKRGCNPWFCTGADPRGPSPYRWSVSRPSHWPAQWRPDERR